MTTKRELELEQRIFLDVEACCRKRGLIKVQNGYEYYAEGAEAFQNNMVKEIMQSYKNEQVGKKKPYFTGPKGLETAIAIACNKRINGFWKNNFLQEINRNYCMDEYTISFQGDFDTFDDGSELRMDAARPENVSSRFGEPINGYNQTALLALEEFELLSALMAGLDRLVTIGTNGKLYRRTIQFYLEHFDEKMTKSDEISALSEFLGVDQNNAIITKYWARNFLKRDLSYLVDFDGCKKSMTQKRELAKRFKRISNEDLLKILTLSYSHY